jgi:hypothetical protein
MRQMQKMLITEMAEWNAEYLFDFYCRHSKIRVFVGDTSRFLTFTETNTDCRGMKNKISELRHLLTSLGATKRERTRKQRRSSGEISRGVYARG